LGDSNPNAIQVIRRIYNPYSKSLFKTMKYLPTFPDWFGSLPDARVFMNRFVKVGDCVLAGEELGAEATRLDSSLSPNEVGGPWRHHLSGDQLDWGRHAGATGVTTAS